MLYFPEPMMYIKREIYKSANGLTGKKIRYETTLKAEYVVTG